MSIASQTPDGESQHCPICGIDVRIAPSRPPADAPCPNCGTLLWFDERSNDWRTLVRYCPEIAKPLSVKSHDVLSTTNGPICVGMNVRMRSGFFSGKIGGVARIDKRRGRVVVAINRGGFIEFVELWADQVVALS